jgi:hypothetical protein
MDARIEQIDAVLGRAIARVQANGDVNQVRVNNVLEFVRGQTAAMCKRVQEIGRTLRKKNRIRRCEHCDEEHPLQCCHDTPRSELCRAAVQRQVDRKGEGAWHLVRELTEACLREHLHQPMWFMCKGCHERYDKASTPPAERADMRARLVGCAARRAAAQAEPIDAGGEGTT